MSNFPKIKFWLATFIILVVILSVWIVYQKTSTRLNPDKFAEIYVKLATLRQVCGPDLLKWEQGKKSILKEYNISSEDVNKFIQKYNRNPEEWALIWEKIIEKLQKEQQKLTNRPALPQKH